MIVGLLIRTIFIYFYVLIAMRVMGKREIGKLSIFDLVVSIMIAEVSAVALEDPKAPLSRGMIIIAALVTLQILVSFITLKNQRIRGLVEGRPTVLIANGKINDAEMRRTRYSMSDLLTQLREKDIANVADVEFAILETSGKLTVFPKANKRQVTVEDLNLSVPRSNIPLPLIIDGQPIDKNIALTGKTRYWLKQELKKMGYHDFREIFFCSLDNQGQLFVDRKEDG